jgi:hypothetical protein
MKSAFIHGKLEVGPASLPPREAMNESRLARVEDRSVMGTVGVNRCRFVRTSFARVNSGGAVIPLVDESTKEQTGTSWETQNIHICPNSAKNKTQIPPKSS